MSRRHRIQPLSQLKLPPLIAEKTRSPVAIILGSPSEVIHALESLPGIEATCFQMDAFQGERLRAELAEAGLSANVVLAADLWDLPATFQTALFMPARGGERELKIDMVDQAYHILRERGILLVWSPYQTDDLFTGLLKKVFGKVHTPPHASGVDLTTCLWSVRTGEQPRRRHELTFQVKIADGPSCRFLSRPGTFSYGKFDLGARALCEVMEVEPGDRVLDLGCGVGTNGVFASQKAGPNGFISFVDSNHRAIALTEINAKANGVSQFEAFASSTVTGPQEDSFDVVIANPPYFANSSIAQLFIHRAKAMLTPQGRFYLVTKQPVETAETMLDTFGEAEAVELRGYTIVCA
jgi:23S rRNA (guanine1835-N2)-methyltransferase